MVENKENREGKYILWLSELSKSDVPLAGGKGANLGEMYNSKFPVPPAFVVTTTAYNYFLTATEIDKKINEIIESIDVDNTKELDQKAKLIHDIVVDAQMPEDLKTEILESYDSLNVDLSSMQSSPSALTIMKNSREPVFVSVRSSATAEDLSDSSFAGQQDSFINIKGNSEVIDKVKRVFASIFNARSIYYRKKKGFKNMVGIAAVVQKMINSVKSGVIFSVDPVKGDNVLIESVFGQGEGIVSGRIKPDHYVVSRNLEVISEDIADKKTAIIRDSNGVTKIVALTEEKSNQRVLKTHEIKELADYALKLEDHYKAPQDIEFAIEDSIYIVQTRPITSFKSDVAQKEISGKLITQGLGASPGVASGIVKVIHSMEELEKVKKGDVLVTTMTNPDMVVSMQRAAAIITDEGGVTAHAAIVSREMGIPCVVGTQNATSLLADGMEVTVDGFHGKVYEGKAAEAQAVEILPIVQTKTKIKVSVDIPEYAERAAKTNAYGIGLVRIEGIIADSGKHPLYYEKFNKLNEYKDSLKKGLTIIAEHFSGKEIWVRTSDIRSDEYSHLPGAVEIEKNPMLGMHGIRFSLKHPEILKAELQAIKEIEDKAQFGIMFPQIISVEETKAAMDIVKEVGVRAKVGIMVETPAAVMVIEDICKLGINFISFGTNDLTQYTLAIDRGNEEVQYLYNEMNFAVLKSLSRVIRTCKQHNVETSICGQAANKKEMVEFLVKQNIDSLSVNADSANEISLFVKELEDKRD